VAALADLVGLTPDLLTRRPPAVGDGQLLRACLARALIHQPDYLLCDEATTMLDASTRAHIASVITNYQQRPPPRRRAHRLTRRQLPPRQHLTVVFRRKLLLGQTAVRGLPPAVMVSPPLPADRAARPESWSPVARPKERRQSANEYSAYGPP
jgi:hypothetical protein